MYVYVDHLLRQEVSRYGGEVDEKIASNLFFFLYLGKGRREVERATPSREGGREG